MADSTPMGKPMQGDGYCGACGSPKCRCASKDAHKSGVGAGGPIKPPSPKGEK